MHLLYPQGARLSTKDARLGDIIDLFDRVLKLGSNQAQVVSIVVLAPECERKIGTSSMERDLTIDGKAPAGTWSRFA